jgi:hypothetical protein
MPNLQWLFLFLFSRLELVTKILVNFSVSFKFHYLWRSPKAPAAFLIGHNAVSSSFPIQQSLLDVRVFFFSVNREPLNPEPLNPWTQNPWTQNPEPLNPVPSDERRRTKDEWRMNVFYLFIKKIERSDSTLRHSIFDIRYSAVRFSGPNDPNKWRVPNTQYPVPLPLLMPLLDGRGG